MKKFSKQFTMMLLILMFSMTMVVSAKEPTTPKTSPEDKFNGFISELEQKQASRFDEANANWTQNQTKRQSRDALFLEMVAQYAPDLSISYEEAFAEHDALHLALFNIRTGIRSDYNTATIQGLTALKDDLFEKVNNGELTYKEARETMKIYLTTRKESFIASKDSYQAVIAPAAADWEIKVTEIKALHQELKAAIAADDSVAAASIIAELYDYLIAHIAFDQLKLDTMNSMF